MSERMPMQTTEYKRCWWCGDDPLYQSYHDNEWGVPVHDDRSLFEFLCLEGAQAGLSWITILRKREHYRLVFDDFDAEKCLRINLILRVGYLAVGDLESTAYIKLCENLAYSALDAEELEYVIQHMAPMADRMEQALESNGDIA